MSQIAIIIVNWNTGNLLAACLRSLIQLSAAERAQIAHIVVVDNASTDHSLAEAKKVQAGLPLQFLELPRNLGFAVANNRGVKALSDQILERAHILLLNPDTQVRPGVVSGFIQVLAEEPKAGIVGPRLLNRDGSIQPSVRAYPTLSVFITWFLKLTRFVREAHFWREYIRSDFDYAREQTVDQVMGAAFCIRRETWQQVGELDEKFWIWFEEVDYCKRAHTQGWQVVYTPLGEVVHVGGTSFGQLIGFRRVVPFLTSALHYVRKHLALPSQLVLWLLYPFAVLLAIPASLMHLFYRARNKQRL